MSQGVVQQLVVGVAVVCVALPVSRAALRLAKREDAIISSSACTPGRVVHLACTLFVLLAATPYLVGHCIAAVVEPALVDSKGDGEALARGGKALGPVRGARSGV